MTKKDIQTTLKEAGYKLTKPRLAIASWITKHDGIFSVSEIRKALGDLDKVSIYRTVELFCSLDIIHDVINLHGEQHYEVHGKKHHHHIACTGCEKTACVPCTVPKKTIPLFTNIHHTVAFTGLCKACAQ